MFGKSKKQQLVQPDLTIKIHLCAQHKDFCSVNKKIVPNSIIPLNVISGSEMIEVSADIKNIQVIHQGGKAYAPFEKKTNTMVVVGNKAIPYQHNIVAETQVSGDASKVEDIFVVSPELVIQNLRLIQQCKGCKVELDVGT